MKRLSRNKRLHGALADRFGGKGKAPVDQWAGLPAVPGVQHLNEKGKISIDLEMEHVLTLFRRLWHLVLLLTT